MSPPSTSSVLENTLRAGVMEWVAQQRDRGVTAFHYQELAAVEVAGVPLRIKDQFKGIWRPRDWHCALAITTAYRPEGADRPYADGRGPDGLFRYKWQGHNPNLAANVALRNAMVERVPLVWFFGVERGWYSAIAPVWLVAEEPDQHQFVVAIDESQALLAPDRFTDPATRSYVERLTRQRVHQPIFRDRVLRAYESHCAVCKLGHPSLLDAAHIIADNQPKGDPVVPNGLSLCKIHHAAYDDNILGISPDYQVSIRSDILDEIDGPMLQYGLKERHGQSLMWLPRNEHAKPDRERLAARFADFTAATD